jgi:hypothetical protein
MPKTRRRGLGRAWALPGTLRRSSKQAQESFTEAHDKAVQAYGEGDRADRAAYTEFKRKFENAATTGSPSSSRSWRPS